MSRLDDHVGAVQNKLAMQQFVESLIFGSVFVAAAVLVATLIDRLFSFHPPKPALWMYGAVVALVLFALSVAIRRRPDAKTAAVAIDHSLGLKEKISTALYLRRSDDPFAVAAIKDAEATAANVTVNLRQHFPLRWPRQIYWTGALLLTCLLVLWLVKPLDLFGHRAAEQKRVFEEAQTEVAKQNVSKALATIEAMPPNVANSNEDLKIAKSDLASLLQKPITDPASANRTASKALQDAQQAIKEQIKNSSKFAQAQNESKMMRSMQVPQDAKGPVADAQRDLAKGDFQSALNQLDDTVKNFDKMDQKQQADAAKQMTQMAQQLSQMAKDPAQQQKMQDQLHQMGLNQQQAHQAQQLLQQAAQGDKQAQQQLQQMAQQQMAQMNNGQGATPQQQQKIQQMLQQMQAQANAQSQAQQMSQSAQQMAQAMQQAQQAAQQGQGQPKQGGQPQQGNQPMQQAMNQMQQQMQQMQAQQQDAQQIAAAQQAAQQAGQQAGQQGGQSGQSGDGQANQGAGQAQGNQPGGQQGGNQAGQWANGAQQQGQGQGQGNKNGMAGGGQGAGDRTFKTQAPYTVKPEVSPSQDEEAGQILASTFIKDNKPIKGSSSAQLQNVAQSAEQDQTDEIDSERISRSAQSAVKNYFNSMQGDQ